MTQPRPPLPPFDEDSALHKVQGAEDAWNTCDPEKVAMGYSQDSVWRNRGTFVTGHQQIIELLRDKWSRELDMRCANSCGPSPATESRCATSAKVALQ